ncbi:MAG TPA: hypothetical protein VJP86_16620 [Vicinamibacterales bacterium]|nr:hypothetical protein [Vicinamibacterales bacterium]
MATSGEAASAILSGTRDTLPAIPVPPVAPGWFVRVQRAFIAAASNAFVAAGVLLVIAGIVYHPALNRVFAADQLWYFAELKGDRSLGAGLAHYDYAASRQYWKGDDLLFRPLLFVWLALANHLFAYHHVWWNVATLGIHVMVSWSLFRLLQTIAPSPLALASTVLFLVLKPSMELPLWNHLGGYLLACWFFLVGVRAFVRAWRDPSRQRAYLLFAASFTAAALSYEAMVPAAAVGGMLLAVRLLGARRLSIARVALVLAPVTIFCVLYAFHAGRVSQLDYVDRADGRSLFAAANALNTIGVMWRAVLTWTRELVMPTALTLETSPFGRFGKSYAFSLASPAQALNAAAVFLAAIVAGSAISWRRIHEHAALVALLTVTMAAYVFLIAFGRSTTEVAGVSYYAYVFAIVAGLLLYSALDVSRFVGWRGWSAAIAMLAMVFLHARGSLETARHVEQVNHYASLYLTRVIGFVDLHRDEPDFTFSIEDHPEAVDPTVTLLVGYANRPGAPTEYVRASSILFAPYLVADRPKYLLNASAERVLSP